MAPVGVSSHPGWVLSHVSRAGDSNRVSRAMGSPDVVVRAGPGCSLRGRGYPHRMLLACPFCRELFDRREEKSCAVCGVALVPMERLPPSSEVATEDGIPDAPEYQPLPVTYLGRGRGALAALALLGVVAF